MSCWCKFEDNAFSFQCNKLTCIVPTKDDDDNIYRPKGNLTEFYENLKNKLKCKMDFDNKDKIITISYPEYTYDHKELVKFDVNGTTIILPYDLCFEEICEFLKEFQFIM